MMVSHHHCYPILILILVINIPTYHRNNQPLHLFNTKPSNNRLLKPRCSQLLNSKRMTRTKACCQDHRYFPSFNENWRKKNSLIYCCSYSVYSLNIFHGLWLDSGWVVLCHKISSGESKSWAMPFGPYVTREFSKIVKRCTFELIV